MVIQEFHILLLIIYQGGMLLIQIDQLCNVAQRETIPGVYNSGSCGADAKDGAHATGLLLKLC